MLVRSGRRLIQRQIGSEAQLRLRQRHRRALDPLVARRRRRKLLDLAASQARQHQPADQCHCWTIDAGMPAKRIRGRKAAAGRNAARRRPTSVRPQESRSFAALRIAGGRTRSLICVGPHSSCATRAAPLRNRTRHAERRWCWAGRWSSSVVEENFAIEGHAYLEQSRDPVMLIEVDAHGHPLVVVVHPVDRFPSRLSRSNCRRHTRPGRRATSRSVPTVASRFMIRGLGKRISKRTSRIGRPNQTARRQHRDPHAIQVDHAGLQLDGGGQSEHGQGVARVTDALGGNLGEVGIDADAERQVGAQPGRSCGCQAVSR